jgi:hypothetical protein
MELFKDINYEYKSELTDVGVYKTRLRLYRWTMGLELQADANYSAATGGLRNPREYNDNLIYASANISARVKPIDQFGKLVEDPKWISDIVDPNIIFDIFLKLIEFDNSFRAKKEGTVNEGKTV